MRGKFIQQRYFGSITMITFGPRIHDQLNQRFRDCPVSSFELLQGRAAALFTMSLCVSLLLLGISLFIPCTHGNEVQTLLAFKSSITADPYGFLKDWMPDSPNPCNWTGISCCDPDSLNSSSSFVQEIVLAGYSLEGHISPVIGNLSYLRELDLSSNLLNGSIPASFGMLSKLVMLDLSDNRLSGVIPSEVGKISSLQNLDLSSNALTGSIPASFGNLSNLYSVYLRSNNLSGVISSEVGKMSSLEYLDLSSNALTGSIPSFQNLSSIYSIDLSHNHLSGVIPIQLVSPGSLRYLDLSHNLLNSTIPFEAEFLVSVCYLDLSSNILTGTIPSNLYRILALDDYCCYNVSHNALSGVLPLWLVSRTLLELDLSYNDFEGSVPCKFNSMTVILNGNPRLYAKCASNNKAKENNFINKGKGSSSIFILGIVLGGFAALCLVGLLWLLVFHKLKSLQNNKLISLVDPKFIRLSEHQLAVATDNFSEHNLVGTGGSAHVYRGVLPPSEFVAVKVFYGLDLEEDDEQRTAAETRFLRECHTLGQIRHRNLVKIITTCCGEKIRALILQFMPNGNLHELLHLSSHYGRLMPLSLRTRLLFIKDIASALSYLHNDCCPPIIHCDVKPHNVLLKEDMTACLSDFGMAKILQTSDKAPSLKLEGSCGYIAPEYGTGVGPWSRGDVYSFGMVVLEVLTRTKPTNEEILGEQQLSEWVSSALMQGTEYWYPLICGREGQHEISALSNANISVLEELLKMGVWCCRQEPHARPTMREVEGFICKICIEFGEEAKPLQLTNSLSRLLTSIDIKAQASKRRPPVSRSSTF